MGFGDGSVDGQRKTDIILRLITDCGASLRYSTVVGSAIPRSFVANTRLLETAILSEVFRGSPRIGDSFVIT